MQFDFLALFVLFVLCLYFLQIIFSSEKLIKNIAKFYELKNKELELKIEKENK